MLEVSGCNWLEVCIHHTQAQTHTTSYPARTFRHKKCPMAQWLAEADSQSGEKEGAWPYKQKGVRKYKRLVIYSKRKRNRIHGVLVVFVFFNLAEKVWLCIFAFYAIYLFSNLVWSWWMINESLLIYPCGGVCIITQLFSLINTINGNDCQQVFVSFSIFSISNLVIVSKSAWFKPSAHLICLLFSDVARENLRW